MGGALPLTGPDLAAGVAIEDVPDGGILRGHAGGVAVLLSRHGEACAAIGAACTHYGAPLDEGLVTGGAVRCPWHHACFDLRTGEPLRAPALRPLPRFAVEVRDGRVRVSGPAGEAPRRSATGPESVVIVGTGAAAAAAAVALRREGYERPITLVGPDPAPLDRPNLSKDWLAGTAPDEWLPLWDDGFRDEHGLTMRAGRVASLDPAGHRVRLADGAELAYEACLLATGADPVRLRIPGAERALVLRTLADAKAIVARASGRAVVVGSSFLGLEVAASLAARGLAVTVVGPESVPLERVLGRAIGEALQRTHESHGTAFRLGRTATAIEADAVVLDDGTRLPADLVVMATGVRPAVGLATEAGLAVEDGVLVDATLRTSAPDVWAAGDLARWPDPHTGRTQRIEHFVLAQRQGQTAARNVLGRGEPFEAVPFFWTAQHDVTVQYVGFPGGTEVHVHGDPGAGDAAVAFREGRLTRAVATIGRERVALEAERLLEADDHDGLLALLPSTG